MKEDYIHKELSAKIIGAAMEVLNTLKPGLDEKVYENALVIELQSIGLKVDQQKEHVAYYKNKKVGKFIPDLIVEDAIIVDPKVVSNFNENHVAQMTGYLAITGLQLALLLNFKHSQLGIRRVISSSSSVKSA
jgi:GxxExxY protein